MIVTSRDASSQFLRHGRIVAAADECGQGRGQVVARALGNGTRGRLKARVLDKHGLVERTQRRRRLDAKLLDQNTARVLETPQGLGLSSASVVREHQLLPAPLT